jgi:hypothetical protein
MPAYIKKKISALLLLTAALCSSVAAQVPRKSFTVYEFIPYKDHVQGAELSRVPALDQYLEGLGIHRVKVVYLERFMTDGKPDEKKIEAIAKSAKDSPKAPVSFDTEFGDRFHPETVIPQVLEILSIYHRYNTVTPAGVYATAPQNTYAWKPDIDRFTALSERYEPVAQQVDFLSPVLYNYEGPDTEAWKRAAVYNMAAARRYNTGKPIIPYLSPIIRMQDSGKNDESQHGAVRMLTEQEMVIRLQTLYDLGADGCIVWASSGDRTLDGNLPVFDRNSGWGKALSDFAASHSGG